MLASKAHSHGDRVHSPCMFDTQAAHLSILFSVLSQKQFPNLWNKNNQTGQHSVA